MKAARLTILVALAALGCGGRSERPEKDGRSRESRDRPSESHPDSDASGRPLLRLDEDRLRDLRLTTRPAEARTGGEEAVLLGELWPDEGLYAEVSAPTSARVLRVIAAPGQLVQRGSPLVELQSAEVSRVRSQLSTAAAQLELARRTLDRKQGLAEERIVPRREVQEAEAALAAAEAEHRAASAALGALGTTGDEGGSSTFLLRSPVAGTVIEREALRGQVVEPGKSLFRVGSLSRLFLIVHAYERDAVRIRPERPARVLFAALPGKDFTGTVTLVGNQVDSASRTIPIRIQIANPDGVLRPGMSATARVPVGDAQERLVSVPAAALQRFEDGWCVFVSREPGVFEVRPVGRGRDLGGEIEVLNRLQPGEVVVDDGAFLLKAELEKARGGGEHHDH